MKKANIALIVFLLVLGLMAGNAAADSITYDYNYIISGPGNLPQTLGTITFTENGNLVDFNIVLSNSSWKVLELGLNFDDSKFNSFSNLALLSGTLQISRNRVSADGYPYKFDIEIPENGNLGTMGGYSGSISWNNGNSNLNISDFSFMDTGNLLYSSIHIGSLASDCSSVWAGATPHQVPEPSTLILLGFSLVGIVGLRRKIKVIPIVGRFSTSKAG